MNANMNTNMNTNIQRISTQCLPAFQCHGPLSPCGSNAYCVLETLCRVINLECTLQVWAMKIKDGGVLNWSHSAFFCCSCALYGKQVICIIFDSTVVSFDVNLHFYKCHLIHWNTFLVRERRKYRKDNNLWQEWFGELCNSCKICFYIYSLYLWAVARTGWEDVFTCKEYKSFKQLFSTLCRLDDSAASLEHQNRE